jgi:hypothetical protein
MERLAVKDVERREQYRGALNDLHSKDCTFKPTINPHSQLLASRTEEQQAVEGLVDDAVPVHERLYRTKGQQQHNKDHLDPSCTFRPQIDLNKRYANTKSRYGPQSGPGIMNRIREDLARGEDHLNERRQQLEEELRKECTFAPQTHHSYDEPTRPVAVSGLGRFFELKSLAQKKQREQHERELRAFHPEVSGQARGSRCGGVTIVEPFDLSAGCCHVQSGFSLEDKDCTFTPFTTESVNRETIRRIMEHEQNRGLALH